VGVPQRRSRGDVRGKLTRPFPSSPRSSSPGIDLSNISFAESAFADVDLSECKLRGTSFYKCDLQSVLFDRCDARDEVRATLRLREAADDPRGVLKSAPATNLAIVLGWRHAFIMRERCEVCKNFRPETEFAGDRRTILLEYEVRPVRLCIGHARIAANSGVQSFEDLRELYGSGRRSFVPRRGPIAAASDEDRRLSRGRRATDVSRAS
jgi:hypothetical protein